MRLTDDPLTILRAAGIECPEVEALRLFMLRDDAANQHPGYLQCQVDAAIFALARLVAKYKWQRDEAAGDIALEESMWEQADASPPFNFNCHPPEKVIADLGARWEARDA